MVPSGLNSIMAVERSTAIFLASAARSLASALLSACLIALLNIIFPCQPTGAHQNCIGLAGRNFTSYLECLTSHLRARLLLGNAVNIAAAQQNLPAWHHHHAMLREQATQNCLGPGLLGVVELGRDDAAVDDQEVDVGTRQTDRRITLLGAGHQIDAGAFFIRSEE